MRYIRPILDIFAVDRPRAVELVISTVPYWGISSVKKSNWLVDGHPNRDDTHIRYSTLYADIQRRLVNETVISTTVCVDSEKTAALIENTAIIVSKALASRLEPQWNQKAVPDIGFDFVLFCKTIEHMLEAGRIFRMNAPYTEIHRNNLPVGAAVNFADMVRAKIDNRTALVVRRLNVILDAVPVNSRFNIGVYDMGTHVQTIISDGDQEITDNIDNNQTRFVDSIFKVYCETLTVLSKHATGLGTVTKQQLSVAKWSYNENATTIGKKAAQAITVNGTTLPVSILRNAILPYIRRECKPKVFHDRPTDMLFLFQIDKHQTVKMSRCISAYFDERHNAPLFRFTSNADSNSMYSYIDNELRAVMWSSGTSRLGSKFKTAALDSTNRMRNKIVLFWTGSHMGLHYLSADHHAAIDD